MGAQGKYAYAGVDGVQLGTVGIVCIGMSAAFGVYEARRCWCKCKGMD